MNGQRIHPLDKLIADDSLFLLEAMIPFVDLRMKKLLVIFIKYKELSSILSSLNDPVCISECGFDCHPRSTDDLLSEMCKFMPGDFSNTINQMKQMKDMMSMMEIMNSTSSQECPDMQEQIYNNNHCDNDGSLFDSVMSILDSNQ